MFLFSLFPISPPGPAVSPLPGVWCLWSDSSYMLRFCPGMDSLTLSVRQVSGSCPQESIMVLRERLGDYGVLKMVRLNNRVCYKNAIVVTSEKFRVEQGN